MSYISINIVNSNKNSLSTLSVNYIGYFYNLYAKLITIFPNLFSRSSLAHFDNLIKYINCTLIRFSYNIKYFISSIPPSLTSNLHNIQSLVDIIPKFEELIKNVFDKLKIAIGANITLICLKISNIDKTIKCCQNTLGEAVNDICIIIKLTTTKCTKGIFASFKKCLNQIKCKFVELEIELCNLYHSYCYIICLEYETQDIIKCNKEISSLKTKICDLKSKFECGIADFKAIECYINCIKCIINQLKQQKQELCKQFDNIRLIMCITNSTDKVNIVIINASSVKKKIECLTEKIDKIGSEFNTIEENTTDLKHSLVFNEYYFQISSYILTELSCIETQQKTLCEKLTNLKEVDSGISLISTNINLVKSVIEKVNERRDDLGYIRDGLCSIIPKMCQIKASANAITTKSTELQCVVDPLKKIKSSIENLKKLEYDKKCLQILECTSKKTLIWALICIEDKLNINSITTELSKLQTGISSLNFVICNINKLLGNIKTIENRMRWIVAWINKMNKRLDNIIKRLIRCSLESLSTHLINTKIISLGVDKYNKFYQEVYGLYSLINITDYGVVVNRLFESSKKIDQILQLIPWPDGCKCILGLESKNKDKIDLHSINVQKIIQEITKQTKSDDLKLDQIKRLVQDDIKDNHFCLCMVFKYILYTKIVDLTYLMSIDLETLSTISRKFTKYKFCKGFGRVLYQFIVVYIELLNKVSMYILMKYKYTWFSGHPFYVKCFCMYSTDLGYYSVIGLILVLSSLIENIWSMDPDNIRIAIDNISSLLSEYQSLHVYTNYGSGKSTSNVSSSTDSSDLKSFSMNLTGYTKKISITKTGNSNGDSSMVLNTEIKKSEAILVNKSVKLFFKTVVSSLSILIATPLFALVYSNISGLAFYMIDKSPRIGLSSISIRRDLMGISIKYLNEICTKKKECSCQVKNGVCKICPILKIRINCLSISFKEMGLIIGNVSGDILLNYLMGSINITEDFITNLCVAFGEVYTIMLKNTNPTYRSHKNLNTKISIESRNWGYDTHFEHDVTGNSFSEGYPNLRSSSKVSSPKLGGKKMFKMLLSRLVMVYVIVFTFIYLIIVIP